MVIGLRLLRLLGLGLELLGPFSLYSCCRNFDLLSETVLTEALNG